MELIKSLVEKSGKTEEEIWALIEVKRKELDYLISEEGAAHIIASELGVNSKTEFKANSLVEGSSGIEISLKVLRVYPVHEFTRGDKAGKVLNLVCEDDTGQVNVSLWDDKTKIEINEGDLINIISGYVKKSPAGVEIRVGNTGTVDVKKGKVVVKNEDTLDSVSDGQRIIVRAAITRIFRREPFFNSPEGKQLMVSGIIDDGTSSLRAIFFRGAAESLIGVSREKAIEVAEISNFDALLDKVPLLEELHIDGRVKHNEMTEGFEVIVNQVLKLDAADEVDKRLEKIMGV
ncbi:MAG: hypothetical protein GOU98_00970 [Candidatus Altiarchaeota archaeon]|nr:hypothetical protein [Candidatus Altiarchaeota archaeon]